MLYAPTAYNKQNFIVKGNDNKKSLHSKNGRFGKIETGIRDFFKLAQERKILNGLSDLTIFKIIIKKNHKN